MANEDELDRVNLEIAKRWCAERGEGWSVIEKAGRGGTAPVFSINSPTGPLALKVYDELFSSGAKGAIESKRVDHQKRLGIHNCPYLVKIHDGGLFEDRLFVLMSRAPGRELEKCLKEVPRDKIRHIVDCISKACVFLREQGLCHRDIKSANIFVSNDFEQVTLLDLSVMRDIYDPVGLGTDHGDQLPVVATARYSPPEYLFRLVEPGPDLWHAVDVYQLGALLYDLIIQEPLFEAEYQRSKDNRYRFAWAVATTHPEIHSADVDFDLVLLARNAMDKDWKRRSQITLEDFFSEAVTIQNNALNAIGFSETRRHIRQDIDESTKLRRVSEIATDLQKVCTEYLRDNGITAEHGVAHEDSDRSKTVYLRWSSDNLAQGRPAKFEFRITLTLHSESWGDIFKVAAELQDEAGQKQRLDLPDVADGSDSTELLLNSSQSALRRLASLIIRDRR